MKTILAMLLAAAAQAQTSILLKPARVFDGETSHENWAVWVKGLSVPGKRPAPALSNCLDLRSCRALSVDGDPTKNISSLRRVKFVMKAARFTSSHGMRRYS
jgi:hypothetical protein